MRFLDDILIRVSNDPVTYALRIVFFLGVLLVVFLLFVPIEGGRIGADF